MLKSLKQQRNKKKQLRSGNIQKRRSDFRQNYDNRFPAPVMDKPTDHLIEPDQTAAVSQSMKNTKQILKFWLIGLAIVVV